MDPNRQTPAQPEKESYSYDEMMERLRGQRSGGGSRRIKIESPGGTVEIKKRRRRTHQPIKERQQRVSKLRRNVLLGIIALILLLVGVHLFLNVRYQSEGFRASVSKSVSAAIGAEAELAPLNIKGLDVHSRRMLIEPPSPSLLKDAEFIGLHGRLSAGSLFDSGWHLTSLAALHGKLRFHAPPRGAAGLAQAGATLSGRPLIGAGLGFSSKPAAFNIDLASVGAADFVWTNGLKETVFLEGATLSSKRIGERTDMQISGSTLRFGDWPDFQFDTAKVSFTNKEIRVEDTLMSLSSLGGDSGEAVLSGTIDLSGRSPIAEFVCSLQGIPAKSLVEPVWRGKIEGLIEAPLRFQADLSVPGSLKVSGPFSIRDGSFGDITPTKRLAAFLSESSISRFRFHSIGGNITIADGRRHVEDLEVNAPNLLKIKGSYTIEPDGVLNGSLELSLANEILEKLSFGKPDFFTPIDGDDRMSSTMVTLGGTSLAPTEDLTARLQAALEKFEIDSAAPPASSYPTIPLAPDAIRSKEKSGDE